MSASEKLWRMHIGQMMSSLWKAGYAPAWGLEKRALMSLQYLHLLFDRTSRAGFKDGCNLGASKPKAAAPALICSASKTSCEVWEIKEKGKIKEKGMKWLSLTCPLAKLAGEVLWGSFWTILLPSPASLGSGEAGIASAFVHSISWCHHMDLRGLGAAATFPPTHWKGKCAARFSSFYPLWLEENAQLLKENIGQDAGVRNDLEGFSLGQVSGNPENYQFANCESAEKKKKVICCPCPPWLSAVCKGCF